MADFKRAIGVVLEHEGGLVNHPSDPGGITNFGVSLRFASSELLKDLDNDGKLDGDFDEDGDVDADDIRKMSVSDAMFVYKTYWWQKYHYELINDQDIATKVFDMAINMGWKRAHTLIQTAINELQNKKIAVDGVLGAKSIDSINDLDARILLKKICAQQLEFYKRLAAQKPKLAVFLKGWTRRAVWPFSSIKEIG